MITNKAAITIHMYLFVDIFAVFSWVNILGVRYLESSEKLFFMSAGMQSLGFGAMEYGLLNTQQG